MMWFAAQHRKDFTHYNNCSIHINEKSVRSSNDKPCNCCNFKRTIRDHSKNTSYVIFSFESQSLDYISQCEELSPISDGGKLKKIIVLRDHYNFIASYLTKWNEKRLHNLKVIDHWKEYAREIQKIIANPENSEYDYILYNQWCQDGKYRKSICERYGLRFTDDFFKNIPKHGNGSSFRGLETKQERRDYNGRHKLLKNDPVYQKLVGDPELVELTKDIFGIML